uniref:Tafazzin family protein n=1 Tax=Angiostrongylus cantonensis TaxID=6313 RepID=A0A0K0DDP0_ANGCA
YSATFPLFRHGQARWTGTKVDRIAPFDDFISPWPIPTNPSLFYKIRSYITISLVASLSKLLFIGGANKLNVHNRERFLSAWEDRSRPLITVSNHRSNIDDPVMWSAHNICFTKKMHTVFFALGRCVPCVRGKGVYQKGMDFCVDKLNENGWVHMFPEGRVTANALRFKWGVGRLIMETIIPPVVIPIWCSNMDKIWSEKPPYYPRYGHTVDLHIGQPIDTTTLRQISSQKPWSERRRRKFITDAIQNEIFKLGETVGNLPEGTALRILRENCDDDNL